jgi:hypothetical protein
MSEPDLQVLKTSKVYNPMGNWEFINCFISNHTTKFKIGLAITYETINICAPPYAGIANSKSMVIFLDTKPLLRE